MTTEEKIALLNAKLAYKALKNSNVEVFNEQRRELIKQISDGEPVKWKCGLIFNGIRIQ